MKKYKRLLEIYFFLVALLMMSMFSCVFRLNGTANPR